MNATEDNTVGTVDVTTSGAENGQTLTITLNSQTYTANISNNAVRVSIPAADLQALSDGQSYTLTANVSDAAGNAADTVTSAPFTVDKTNPGISSITVISNNNTTTLAKEGNEITFKVGFSEAVTLSNASNVKLPFKIGNTSKEAVAQSTTTATIGGTANAINFKYTVESSLTGDVTLVAGPLTLSSSATVQDAAGNALTGNMSVLNGSVSVDTTSPTISSIAVISNNNNQLPWLRKEMKLLLR